MEPKELLRALMDAAGENSNSVAKAVKRPTLQGQIHRFLEGKTREPRRETLRPIAARYGVPLEAFFDPKLARQEAIRLNLRVAGAVAEPAPISFRAEVSVDAAVARLASAIGRHGAARQETIATVLTRLARDPQNQEIAGELLKLLGVDEQNSGDAQKQQSRAVSK